MIIWDAVHVSSLNNGLGLAVVIAISLLIYRRYSSAFFRAWLKAYGAIMALWVAEFTTAFIGRTLPIDLLEFGLASWTAFHLYLTAHELREAKPPWRPLGVLLAGVTVIASVARLAGVPYQVSCLPPFLAYMAAYGWLGLVIVRGGGDRPALVGRFTGWPILGFVAWTLFAYPALQFHQLDWVAFLVAGLLQLAIGCSMFILLFERAGLQLEAKNQQLEQADRWKDEILGIVSHELRTPITAINSAVHLLTFDRTTHFSDRQAEVIGMIDTSATQLRYMVNDILDLARMQAGSLTYDLVPTDLVGLAERVTHGLAPSFEHKGVRLTFNGGPDELPILLDPGRIGQVLKNLLANALVYTPREGEVHLWLSQDDRYALIEVRDTGAGIAPEHIGHIFKKFYRVDNGTTRRSNGLGLGLAISQAIVEQGHGGHIAVESVPGRGTTFRVQLPLDGPELPAINELAHASR